jgi:DNA-binding NarL/FixJ family response regulator
MSQAARVRPEVAVLIVDDEVAIRSALRDLIQTSYPELRVVDAPDGATARKLFDAHRPAVVLVDKNLPDGNGIELTRTIKNLSPATLVAVISIETNAHVAAQAVAAGAVAFVGKDKLFDEIVPLVGAAATLAVWVGDTATALS